MNFAKKFLMFLLILGILSSCDKSYKYVETVQEETILGGTDTKDGEWMRESDKKMELHVKIEDISLYEQMHNTSNKLRTSLT